MKKATITFLSPEGENLTAREVSARTGLTVSAVYARYKKLQDVFAPHTGRGRRPRNARPGAVERTVQMFAEGVTDAMLVAVAADRGIL